MADSPEEGAEPAKEQQLVTIPEMPAHLRAAGIKPVGEARIRQLVSQPGFPAPVIDRGRVRLWDLAAVLAYFASRRTRQGERTDLQKPPPKGTPSTPRRTEGPDGQ
jgi:hypothetical protein